MPEMNNKIFVLSKLKKKKSFEELFSENTCKKQNINVEHIANSEKIFFIIGEKKDNVVVTNEYICVEDCCINFAVEKHNNTRVIFTVEDKLNGVRKYNSANICEKNIHFNSGDIFCINFLIESCNIGDTLCVIKNFNFFTDEYEEKFIEFDKSKFNFVSDNNL
jgi:hypothetical protein